MRGLAIALAVAALVVAGCGAQETAEPEERSLEEVAAATRAQSYRFEMTMKVDGLAEAFDAIATGARDPGRDRSQLRYAFGADDDAIELEIRQVGKKGYTRLSAGGVPAGWTAEDADAVQELIGPFGPLSDPNAAMAALERVGRDVETSLGEEIDGEPTVRYRATVAAIELFGHGASRAERKELEAELEKTETTEAQVTAWADVDGLIRRLDVAAPISEGGRRGEFTSSTRFSGFGETVEIEAPSQAELDEATPKEGVCKRRATPYAADDVLAALREAGYEVEAMCAAGETTIFGSPRESDDDEFFSCAVAAAVPQTRPGRVAAERGNVWCEADDQPTAKRLRAILAGL